MIVNIAVHKAIICDDLVNKLFIAKISLVSMFWCL